MKYYIDFEFIESFHKPLFGKRRHYIDLISVGVACEDGRTYYAISNEFRYKDADLWVRKNVIAPMLTDYIHTYSGDTRNIVLGVRESTSEAQFTRHMQRNMGKSNEQIAYELRHFICPWLIMENLYGHYKNKPIEFWGYYADYDWVLMCSLFGRVVDLPEGFPMYCNDLMQLMVSRDLMDGEIEHWVPKPYKKHHALEDAKWNQKAHAFITKTDRL